MDHRKHKLSLRFCILRTASLFRISLGVGINVEPCMGRYGASVMRKSTTKSTIQFDPLLLKFSMDDINSLAIPSMLLLAVSDRMSGDVRKRAVVC